MVNLDLNPNRQSQASNGNKDSNQLQQKSLTTHSFAARHIGIRDSELTSMLAVIGVNSLDELIDSTVPSGIRLNRELNLPPALTEAEALAN